MSAPSLPTGYDVAKHVSAGRSDCHVTVGFDRLRSHVPRFLVQLQYQTAVESVEWTAIARMDHNETSTTGHDVYQEGLHVDVEHRSSRPVHLGVPHDSLPPNRGLVIRGCVNYLRRETDYFVEVFEERRPPGGPPRWSVNGGVPTHTFISTSTLPANMCPELPTEDDFISLDELDELLAEATGTTPEEIKRGAEEFEIAPPEEATVIGYGDRGSSTDSEDE